MSTQALRSPTTESDWVSGPPTPFERLTPVGDVPLVSGAWRPGDHPGRRRFVTLPDRDPFQLEGGGSLSLVQVAYETWGTLNETASNAILVCHALTGDSHAAGPAADGHAAEGWWDGLVGPGKALDTDRYFVVCANILGGCGGSTGPSSIDPETDRPYANRFPTVTNRDFVRAQAHLTDELGIDRWHSVVGGSMGGMAVLEWGVMYPDRVRSLAVIASTAAASAQQIAWSAVGRLAIANDPHFNGGDYYDAEPGKGPHRGLALARQIGQIHYRSDQEFDSRFGRDLADADSPFDPWGRFDVESYLDHHGGKLVNRFDANSYLVLNRLMDLHDIGRGRGGIDAALAAVKAPTFTASVSSDFLYPPHQQHEIRDGLQRNGVAVTHLLIDSPYGHDGFLVETAAMTDGLRDFLDGVGA